MIGKIVILSLVAGGAYLFVKNMNAIKAPAKIHIVKKIGGGYNARTIPPFGIYVIESEKDNKELINHEQNHWKQYQSMGLMDFYLTYASQMKAYGYDKMPMEKEARSNESEYCKGNYTSCVRSGFAKTVYQPKFRM